MLGAMIAIRQPKGLRSLIISNSPASMPLWVESCNEWRKHLPEDIQKTLQEHESTETYDDPEYKSAVEEFYKRHVCRVYPFPQDFLDSVANVEGEGSDDTVYYTMNGPYEHVVTGSLKSV
jgi:L-proline amide hydrolase